MSGRKRVVLGNRNQHSVFLQPAGSVTCHQIFQQKISDQTASHIADTQLYPVFSGFRNAQQEYCKENPENTAVSQRRDFRHPKIQKRTGKAVLYFM